MKVKFTKLAALLLAGAALFATGCTDYEVDIQKVDKKVDDLISGKVATLENQVAGLQATVATLETQAKHDEDIQKLDKAIKDLEKALKEDYQSKIQDAVNTLNKAIADLTAQVNADLDKKVDKTVFEAAKSELEAAIKTANDKIKALEDADEAFKTQIQNLTDQFTTALNGLDAKITALDNKKADKEQVAKDIAAAVAQLQGELNALETTLNGKITALDTRLTKAEAAITMINETTIPALQAQIDKINNETIPAVNAEIEALKTGKLDKSEFNEYKDATAQTIQVMQAAIQNLIDTKLDKSVYDAKMAELDEQIAGIIKKFDDYVLTSVFEETLKLYATKAELTALEENMIGRLAAQAAELKKYADDGDEAVKKYSDDANAALEAALKKYSDDADAALEAALKKYADDADKVLEAALKKYSDDADAALEAALKKYADDGDNAVRAEMKKALEDLEAALKKYSDDADLALEEKLTKAINDAADKLQKQIDKITNEDGTGRLDVLEEISYEYFDKVDELVDLVAFAEGDLQGYIDDAAAKALADAMAYTDEQITAVRAEMEELKDELLGYIFDLYNGVYAALQRLQSINFVPTHDDLKLGVNINVIYATVNPEEGEEVEQEVNQVATFVGQPTKVTYKVTPTDIAGTVAEYMQEMLENAEDYAVSGTEMDKYISQIFWQLGSVMFGSPIQQPAFWFDVKPLQTRADDEEEELTPQLVITKVLGWNEKGEIDFEVLPVGIASPEFIANGLKPVEGVFVHPYDDWNGTMLSFFDEEGIDGPYWSESLSYYVAHQVYWIDELYDYQFRQPYAASLNFYMPDADDMYLNDLYEYWDGEAETEPDIYASSYFMFANEIASPYNVLYPETATVEILPDPYKPEYDEDEDGNKQPKVDEDGYAYLICAVPETQELPYSSLRENPVGEKASQDPKGYRVILDEAVPAVSYNGERPMTLEDASAKYGINLPEVTTSFREFIYSDEEHEDLFVPTEKVYAEIEMNPEKSAAERKEAIGDVITGIYDFTSELGVFSASGDVIITPALGEVKADAEIVWTWDLDAQIDHNIFYGDGDETDYTRVKYAVNVNEEDAKFLEDNLAITIDNFAGLEPVEFTITYTEDPENPEDDPTVVDVTDKMIIDQVAIEDGKLFANFTFPQELWGKVFTVTAVYALEDANITVNGTLTTIDRNREKVILQVEPYTFIVNGPDFNGVYYEWSSDPQHEEIFKAFNDEGVINVKGSDEVEFRDFKYADEQSEFNEAELEGHLRMADDSGNARGYIDFNRNDIVLNTLETFTPAVLAGELFNSGVRDADDPNLWLGNIVTRNVTTFIGEEVEMQMQFNFKVPDYNFLHLSFYTFNTNADAAFAGDGLVPFIQSYPLPDEIKGVPSVYDNAEKKPIVEWWTQVNPSYFTEPKSENMTEADAQNRTSFRHALADYDVSFINLAELAFNVVDDKDNILEADDLEELGLTPKFKYTYYDPEDEFAPKGLPAGYYTDINPLDIPEADKAACNNEYLIYESLWVDNTTFYYLTNEHPYLPALGTLTLTVGEPEKGGYAFPVATRFEFPKNSAKYEDIELDYSKYAMVRWTPFQEAKASGFTIVLDENKIYREPLFKGMNLQDNRPLIAKDKAYYVIKDGEWVVGNVTAYDAEAGTTTPKSGNGYIAGVSAKDAYHIKATFDYSKVELPTELQRLLTIKYSADGVEFVDEQDEEETLTPYIVFDYRSEVQFRGTINIPVVVKLENPWQQTIKFSYNVTIKGVE